jgi:hypothetical protein
MPDWHESPAGQTVPQVPQLVGSDWRLVHMPLQMLCPFAQELAHAPLTQTWPVPHAVPVFVPVQLPDAPQYWLSRVGSMQLPLQSTSAPGHDTVQVPALQISPLAHATPHAPQCARSVAVSTQTAPTAPPPSLPPLSGSAASGCAASDVAASLAAASDAPASAGELPPQSVSPGPHETWHVPEEQTRPAPQTLPHPPQLAGSTCSSTHALPHAVVPPAQTSPHVPIEQTCPVAHALPHMPQFAGSLDSLVQLVPQRVVPPAQKSPHAPTEQTSPAGHTFPHAPQLSLSVAVLVHAPLQDVVPPVQAGGVVPSTCLPASPLGRMVPVSTEASPRTPTRVAAELPQPIADAAAYARTAAPRMRPHHRRF